MKINNPNITKDKLWDLIDFYKLKVSDGYYHDIDNIFSEHNYEGSLWVNFINSLSQKDLNLIYYKIQNKLKQNTTN